MDRHITTHEITWFLEINRNNQLDLDPSYQRRSVWTTKDKQFFLDTVFRNYPSPAIFLHKTLDENGRPTYHVVDGKQRLQSVLEFVDNKVRMADEYGDVRLNSRQWNDLRGESELRNRFWNYKFVVEELVFEDSKIVNDIFDRINRNQRKLTRQELRHAKFDGWFISHIEREVDQPEWRTLGLVTQARERRMADSQFLSELMLVTIEGKLRGFDQDALDNAYAEYDDISAPDSTTNEDELLSSFSQTKAYLIGLESSRHSITKYCRTLNNFYSLWSLLTLEPALAAMSDFDQRFEAFMEMIAARAAPDGAPKELRDAVLQYADNLRGANTDIGPRQARHQAMILGIRFAR